MKLNIKRAVLMMLIIALSLILSGFMDGTKRLRAADESQWSEEGTNGFYGFTILEIVPYKGMGEMGYLVGGQEPVDPELLPLNMDTVKGYFNFLSDYNRGEAVKPYYSYKESVLPVSGTPDAGWKLGRTFTTGNGYFEAVNQGPKLYNKYTGQVYKRVAKGTGSYKAVLPNGAELDDVYTFYEWSNNPVTNLKNVKAYFVYGTSSGASLFNSNIGYAPYCVKRNTAGTGDYDYNTETRKFTLNKGHGAYDVIFVRAYSGDLYYMLADYEIVEDGSGTYSYSTVNNKSPISYVSQAGGDYNSVNITYFKYNENSGNYKWTESNDALGKPSDLYQEGTKTWVKGQQVYKEYQFNYTIMLLNNEWFKRISLCIPANEVDDYPVRVITITPDELNLAENQHYINEANLFYINANFNHNTQYFNLYENYSNEGRSLPNDMKYFNTGKSKADNLNFAVHDLNWTCIDMIFRKVAGIGCSKASIIMDSNYYQHAIGNAGAYSSCFKSVDVGATYDNGTAATSCNLAKLYIMIYQRNMIDFYNSFMNPAVSTFLITPVNVSTSVNRTGTTGSFIRPWSSFTQTSDQSLYWNGNTFLPFGLNQNGVMTSFSSSEFASMGIVNHDVTATTTDLTDNTLTLNGSDFFTNKFLDPVQIPSDSQGQASELLGNQPSFSMADLANVITNTGLGYQNTGGVSYPNGGSVEGPVNNNTPSDPDVIVDNGSEGSNMQSYKRVLNLQPTADFADSETQIRSILTGYQIQITNMTSTQFNASLEDINTRYDMIYMGSGAGRFNRSGSRTDFNDNSLDSYIYFAEGDQIRYSASLFARYRGNDLTEQKVRELNDFLKAGYPVVLDSGLYNRVGIKTNINIDKFIVNYISNSTYPNFLNGGDYNSTNDTIKNSFKKKLKSGLEVIRPRLDLIEPVLANNAPINYITLDPVTNNFVIRFKLIPKGSAPSRFTYDAYIYLDFNGDGIFKDTEEISKKSKDGSDWRNMRESSQTNDVTHKNEYDMTKLFGIYEWQVYVKRSDNPSIRSKATGYVVHSKETGIYILNIVDNGSFAYNIQTKLADAGSLIHKYAVDDSLVSNYNFIVTTKTVQEFMQMYQTAPYDPGNPLATTKLSGYHLLIFDNHVDAITENNNAGQNISDELARGLGVIFTKNALGLNNKSLYYGNNYSNYSLKDLDTYNNMNKKRAVSGYIPSQLYIYRDLSTNGTLSADAAYSTNYLTKANEGPVTRYPYQINRAISAAGNSYSDYVTKDLNLTEQVPVVGWYCLSDSKSPEVRKEGLVTGGTTDELYKGMYSSSPNDVANNYYLFSKGACYYSGIELNKVENTRLANNARCEDEMKLFVNTIIAAYRSAGRKISIPPVITVTDPDLITTPGLTPKLLVRPERINDGNFALSFKIDQSSSNMDLKLLWDGVQDSGENWYKTVYKMDAAGTLGAPIAIDNTSKVINNNKPYENYVVKIPDRLLSGEHTLKLEVVNEDGSRASCEVSVVFRQLPVITIDNAVTGADGTTRYVYADEDYLPEVADNRNGLYVRVEFTVTNALSNVLLKCTTTDSVGGIVPLTDYKIYSISGGVEDNTALDLGNAAPQGTYALYLPMSLLNGKGSRDFTITATDTYNNIGSSVFTLLRRSMFKLD